jgi:hypothetical protein
MADFGREMRAIAKRMNRRVEDVAAETLIDTFTAIIDRTPVDEGRLQGEWQTTVQSPATGKTGNTTPTYAMTELVTTIDDPDLYFFSNNMVYAIPIEYGHSRVKAPKGMVRVSIAETKATLRHLAREVK